MTTTKTKKTEVIIKPEKKVYTKARKYFATGTANVKYFVKTKERKVLTSMVNGIMQEHEAFVDSTYTVILHDSSGAPPELLKSLDPTKERIIWDKSDKRLNINGAPYFYPISLGHITVYGNNAEKLYELNPELAMNDFLFNVGIPDSDRQVTIIVGLDGNRTITKDYFATQTSSVVYEEVEIGTIGSYDLNKYEQEVFRTKGGFIKVPQQDTERDNW
jgi:hypothetical protein